MVAQPDSCPNWQSIMLSRITDIGALLTRAESAIRNSNRHAADIALDEAADACLAAREANDRGEPDYHPNPAFVQALNAHLLEMQRKGRLPVLRTGENADD